MTLMPGLRMGQLCLIMVFCTYHLCLIMVLWLQRLYHEVRHALSHLYVKPCIPFASTSQAEAGGQWQHWNAGAGLGAVVDQQDLPGPQGTKELHLRRKEGPDDEDLETVRIRH